MSPKTSKSQTKSISSGRHQDCIRTHDHHQQHHIHKSFIHTHTQKDTHTDILHTNFYFPALERKISVRANREVLVQKGILLPESPIILGIYPRFCFSWKICSFEMIVNRSEKTKHELCPSGWGQRRGLFKSCHVVAENLSSQCRNRTSHHQQQRPLNNLNAFQQRHTTAWRQSFRSNFSISVTIQSENYRRRIVVCHK